MRNFRFSLLAVTIIFLLAGCMSRNYFQKQESVPQFAWNYNFKPTFTFDITDTNAAYQPSFIIRHTQTYPYNNIWMWVYVKTPGDSVLKKERVNVVLALNNGKWLGRGMGEIYEQIMKFDFGDSIKFNRAGTYTVSFEQNMRINPLPDVLNVGFRLEKKG